MKVEIKTNSIKAVMLALRKEQNSLQRILNGLRYAKRWKETEYKPYGSNESYPVTDTVIDSFSEQVRNIHTYVRTLSKIQKSYDNKKSK